MTYIQKVAKTAKLLGLKGSVAQRGQIENVLHAKFSQNLKDTFESQGYVTKKQVKEFLQELGSNIKVKVKTSTYPAMGNIFSYFKKIIKSKYVELPFDSNNRIYKSEHKKIKSIEHEGLHYIAEIVETKYAARHSTVAKLPSHLRILEDEFYRKTLYNNESPSLNNDFEAKKYTKLYKNKAACLTLSPSVKNKDRYEYIKNEVSNFLKTKPATLEQRIALLQGWRYELKGEVKAFEKGTKAEIEYKYPFNELLEKLEKGEKLKFKEKFQYSEMRTIYNSDEHKTLDKKISALKTFIEETKLASIQNVTKYFLFEPKINILERELSESLQIARMSNKRRINAIN